MNRWGTARQMARWSMVAAAVALAGCGSGTRTNDHLLTAGQGVQAKLRLKHSFEREQAACQANPGHVLVRSTKRRSGETETLELCVQRNRALPEIERRALCPAGQRPQVGVAHRRFDCVPDHRE